MLSFEDLNNDDNNKVEELGYDLIFQNSGNITESILRDKHPGILEILLLDRTTKKNIIWANENYKKFGQFGYEATDQIKPELITGVMENIIMPRAIKDKVLQKERTKERAEVFTPTWVVKLQNDSVDENYIQDDLHTYINRTWLEITCGEGPYMTTRYDMETGVLIPLLDREGFVDRKLKRINEECNVFEQWYKLVQMAYKASYGFEWNGDSLLLARENLLYTFIDNYQSKWGKSPSNEELSDIAIIISYNIFQMDGIKKIIPLSEVRERVLLDVQLSLFDDITDSQEDELEEEELYEEVIIKKGKRVKIMDWVKNNLVDFD